VFDWLAETGNIASDEMRRTFNCGVGMILVLAHDDAESALKILSDSGEVAWQIGRIVRGEAGSERKVHFV
jgi:phosphoribosylformylglycinamidine cyclo-ligase